MEELDYANAVTTAENGLRVLSVSEKNSGRRFTK
jgi:hypothetical protein